MARKKFGTKGQIEFASDDAFYEALGFLAKNNGTTSLHWEHNEEQGAWGSEGRIHCYKNIVSFPDYFKRAFTAGTGNIVHRINCNDYLEHIVNNHGFVLGTVQDQTKIAATVPVSHMMDFNRGLAL